MRKTSLIHPTLSETVSLLGHTDTLVVADAGLPIPAGPRRIDLALTRGIPSFLDTLRVLLNEIHIEKAILAEEILKVSPKMYEEIKLALGTTPIEIVPHTQFKEKTHSATAIVRTGEYTPYANIILVSGAWGFGL
jgi:D-ribose pyranase